MALAFKSLLFGLAMALMVIGAHAAPASHSRSTTSKLTHNQHQSRDPGDPETASTDGGTVTSERSPVGPMAEPGIVGGYGPRFADDIIPY